MPDPPWNTGFLFQDALICGAIGGGLAALFGRPPVLWAMLAAVVGPVFILLAARVVRALPMELPGKESGTYEFAAFALGAAILIGLDPFAP